MTTERVHSPRSEQVESKREGSDRRHHRWKKSLDTPLILGSFSQWASCRTGRGEERSSWASNNASGVSEHIDRKTKDEINLSSSFTFEKSEWERARHFSRVMLGLSAEVADGLSTFASIRWRRTNQISLSAFLNGHWTTNVDACADVPSTFSSLSSLRSIWGRFLLARSSLRTHEHACCYFAFSLLAARNRSEWLNRRSLN